MNIIDGLEIAENSSLRKDEMKLFEFFECDDCGRICKMPMEQYKTYSEDFILKVKIKCQKCTKPQKEMFVELRNAGKSILDIQRIFGVDHNKMYKMINDWGLKGWKPNKSAHTQHSEIDTQHKPIDTQHKPIDTQHKPIDTQHNEPLDHLREVKEMVTNDQITEVSQMVSVINQQPPAADTVNHPPHYTSGAIECIDAIEAAVEGLEPQEAVCVGNVIKYVWRFKKKNKKQDLLKAQWYLQRLIDKQED